MKLSPLPRTQRPASAPHPRYERRQVQDHFGSRPLPRNGGFGFYLSFIAVWSTIGIISVGWLALLYFAARVLVT